MVTAPLLGLLGTVTGMVETFQLITLYGTGYPARLHNLHQAAAHALNTLAPKAGVGIGGLE